MKGYLKYFRVYFIIILVLTVIFAALKLTGAGKQPAERGNTEAVTQERVFDYADKLTDEEEDSLRRLIAKREAQTGCDIVLVTLNESLEEYAKGYEEQLGYLYPYQYVMVYADNFYDEHLFGYNKPQGDGVLLLDNWYRESDGKVYSWLSTCGKAQDRFSSTMIDELLDKALEDVDSNPYKAYKKYVDLFYYDICHSNQPPVRGYGCAPLPHLLPLSSHQTSYLPPCRFFSKNSLICLSVTASISSPACHALDHSTVFSTASSTWKAGCQPKTLLMREQSSFRKPAS